MILNKPLMVGLGISLIANAGLWKFYRSAQAEADRAIAECNSEKLETELETAMAQAAASQEALELEREARAALDNRVAQIEAESLERVANLQTEVRNANALLRRARAESSDECINRQYDRTIWMQFVDAQGGDAGGDPGGPGADPGESP
jgi:hypothetical protein